MKVTIGNATVYIGDALEVLRGMEDESVQCCVTSPPYWGLRDYGTAKWEGGDKDCDHIKIIGKVGNASTLRNDGREHLGPYDGEKAKMIPYPYTDTCGKCGAKRIDNQIGLEKSPEEYIAKLVEVFREVRRVMRKDSTLWLNIGDSYAGGKQGRDDYGDSTSTLNNAIEGHGKTGVKHSTPTKQRKPPDGLKPKDLCGIPWRTALALQADGWWLRSDIIWHKPNPMPESVTDRPTKSHEYIFLMSKSEKYFYDAEAIREPANYDGRHDTKLKGSQKYKISVSPNQGINTLASKGGERWPHVINGIPARNKRSVWTVSTLGFPGAHFATFPPALIEPCILAGSRPGDIILDPFFGSGTTGEVALKYGRKVVGIELNPGYRPLWEKRVKGAQRQMRLCEVKG